MDTITHGIVGALVGKALFAGTDTPAVAGVADAHGALSSPTARVAIAACTLGAIFPDIDIFAGPLAHNPLAIMEWHRNATHSAVVLPIWALILAALAIPLARWLKWKSPPFGLLYLTFAAGIATHIFLDLVTNFGTMVWSPITYSRPAWDWIFILDLTLTAIALVPQMVAWCYREPARFKPRAAGIWAVLSAGALGAFQFARVTGYGFPLAVAGVASAIFAILIFLPATSANARGFGWTRAGWCRAGLALLCIYIGLAAAAHHKALADAQKFAAEEHLQVESLAALPLPPTLTHWVGLVNTKDGVWRTTFYEPSGRREGTRLYADAQSLPFLERVMQLRDVQTYLWFARFPVWRVEHRDDNETAIDISDVRFFRERDPFATDDPKSSTRIAGSRAGRAGFTFEIIFDAQGKVLSHGFREPE
ncbi:MAG TPA: metal-dependent hydrolase [Verrucomicrobiae bacterium]|jgi:membrane-bound metal-dependent hydrolase YbcI (DUF457 family)|nr:metal-dependent hydrolase [Verrucomicrobiae bacterium]